MFGTAASLGGGIVEIVLADHLVSPLGVVILPGKCGAPHPVLGNKYMCGDRGAAGKRRRASLGSPPPPFPFPSCK